MTALSIEAVRERLMAVCAEVEANRDRLTKADQAIGDGDHGVGMARGFKAAREALRAKPANSVGDLFKTVGMAILASSGGASGAVFGTFFMGMAKGALGPDLDRKAFADALAQGLAAVQARGGAKPGDKTMIDALVPASDAAAHAEDLDAALVAAAHSAEAGAEATRDMVATTGKAKTLGERSVGHVDPGAISLSIVLAAFAKPPPTD